MAGAINGLACLATDLGDWQRAVVLHGAAQALQDQTGVQRDRLDDSHRRESLGQAYAALGGEQAQQAYDCGTALGLNQVIDLALGGCRPARNWLFLCRRLVVKPGSQQVAPAADGVEELAG